MKCPNCDYDNTDVKARFCSGCGQELQDAVTTPARTFDSKSEKVKEVEFTSIFANIRVTASKTPRTILKVDGPEKYKKLVSLELKDGRLVVSGNLAPKNKYHYGDSSSIQIVRPGSSSHIKVTINGLELTEKDMLEITLELPENSQLTLGDGTFGNAELGYFDSLKVLNTSATDITADRFSTLQLEVSGSGDFECLRIGKTAEVSLTGSGDMSIDECLGKIMADITGSGDLSIGKADLIQLEINLTASGDCDIKKGFVLDLVVKSSGSGDFDFRGKADTGSFSSSGSGDISVTSCKNIVKERSSGSGDIDIN